MNFLPPFVAMNPAGFPRIRPDFFALHFRANQDYLGTIVVPATIENRRFECVMVVFWEVM